MRTRYALNRRIRTCVRLMVAFYLFFQSLNMTSLRHVQTVQELSDILVLDGGRLLDESGALGHGLDAVSLDDQLVLVAGVLAGHALVHPHSADKLLAQKVPDLDQSVLLGDGAVNGEMSIHSPHLVLVAPGDSSDHVGNVGADGPDSGQLLAQTEPFFDFDGALVDLANVDVQVLEALGQSASWALDGNLASLDAANDAVGDIDGLAGVDDFHPSFLQ